MVESVDRTPQITFKKVIFKTYSWLVRPKTIHRDRLVVQPNKSSYCTNPIFLVGLHRSGTTLIKQIIDSHSNIACPPETFFLSHFERLLHEKKMMAGLETMGFDEVGIIQGLRQSTDYFYNSYAHSKGKRRWADKTPSYISLLPFIEKLYGPECQYVMIYRHPFDVVESLLQKGWSLGEYDSDPFLNNINLVKSGLEAQQAFEAAHPGRVHQIFYEPLMDNTGQVLRPLFEFLNETWEPQVLDYQRFNHDFGMGDSEAQFRQGYRPSSQNWTKWSKEQVDTAQEKLGEQLERLGYSASI